MKKHIITTLFTTVIGCTTAFAQTDGEIGANGDEGASSGTILSYLKEADIDYVGDGLIGHKLDIYYPDDGKETHNVIIHIYGSAWRSDNSKGSADLGTVGLAALKAGYIFVTPNHRSLNDALWPAQINDIKAVVRYLRGNKAALKIDDSFIAISGYSSGGHLASMMGVTNDEKVVYVGKESIDIEGTLGNFRDESSRVDAVCDWSGPVDSRDKTCGNPINISPENEILGDCTPQECPDKHASLATTTYLDAKDVPHMICHGSNDNIVPVCEAEKYRDNLEKAGIYVEWYNSDYGHEVVEDYTDDMISFFNKVRSGEVGQGGSSDSFDPCSNTTAYSDGSIIADNAVKDLGNGYNAELWRETNSGSMTVFGGKADCAFKANWDNSGDFLARVGYYDGNASKEYTDLGEIYAVYNYSKKGDGGGKYSYIGVYGWTKNPTIEYYIVDDSFTPDGDGMFWDTETKGTYKVDGVEYTLKVGIRNNYPSILGNTSFKQVFAVRSSYQTCGSINVTEHFKNWENLGIKMGNIYDCKIHCEVGGGTGSIEYTCASMSWKGQNSSFGKLNSNGSVDPGTPSDCVDPSTYTTKYSGGTTITSNCIRSVGNGYTVEKWSEMNNGSTTVFGDKADCAFKADWDNAGDFLVQVGYYDAPASKKYTDLGEIYAVYNYSKTGNGGSYSYIGVYGWTKNPLIEYYIVDDTFSPDGSGMFYGTEEIGTYKIDGVEYTLMIGQRINAPCIEGSASFKQIFAVRSSYQTCGKINVTEHFKNWEKLGVKMGDLYSCKIQCEVGGGTGSIEYTCASMSWKGQKSSLGKLNCNGSVDPGTPSDCVDPSTYTTKYSGGTTITSNCIRSVGNGYTVEKWSEMNNGSTTVFGNKADCAFKADWDNAGDFLVQVGYYDAPASKKYTDLGKIYAVYNYSKTGTGGGTYSYIGIYGWTKNPLIEYYIVDDSFTPDGSGMFYGAEEIGTYTVDGVKYTLMEGQRFGAACIEGMADFKQIFAVRSSYQTCGKINVTEHFKNWEKLGVKMGGLYSCKIQCEVGGGTGSIEYTCASMSWDGQNSSLGKLNCNGSVDPGTPSDCVDPSSYTTKYSGGTTITSNCIRSVGNGYTVEKWSEMNNGSTTVFGDKADCAFKADWDNAGDFLVQVGYYDAPASKKYTDLGEIYAVYNYSKTGNGGSYSYIGVYGWTKNPLIEYYIVDDSFSPDASGMFYGTEEIGTYKIDGVEYTLMIGQRINAPCIEGSASFKQIFAVRSSYQTCGKINVTEHFKNWEKLGVKMGGLYSCKIQCEVGGGTGSIEYTCASMSWDGQNSSLGKLNCDSTVKEEEIEKRDSINIYPCSYTTKYSGGTTITSNCLRDLGNGYNAEMWGERNNGSMTLFGGEAGCAFKAEWDNTGDFLARVGYYDAKASKKYTDLGEIYAIYNYIKSGDGGGSYSYIGVYGWTKNPMIEYYIVDDTFTPDSEDLFWGTNEIGTYKVDGVEYTLMVGQRINAPCIEGSASFKQIFAVRSSYQTCGIINVSEHFRNWEELGVKMGYIYDCKLLCEVGGGTGSIEYTCASMSWKGQKLTLGSLRNGEGDDTQITSAATYSDTKEFTIMPNPASTEIYIISEGEVENVMIFNAIGDEVARADESKVDVSSLPTGIYFVKATIDGESVVKKLVVTK